MNIFEKMLNITNEISTVNKNLIVGEGKSAYKAVGEADVLKVVKELENKYKVYSYPFSRQVIDAQIIPTEKEYKGNITRSSKQFMRIETIYRFVNIEKTGEYIDIASYGDGIDVGDKAPGKAMTYSDKYALLKAYKMITGDDPDQNISKENEWNAKKVVKINKSMEDALRQLIKNEDVSNDFVISVLQRYNYKKLADIDIFNLKEIENTIKSKQF